MAITEADVVKVLRNLKNGKAAGEDGIPVEFYKLAVVRDEHGHIVKFLLAAPFSAVLEF